MSNRIKRRDFIIGLSGGAASVCLLNSLPQNLIKSSLAQADLLEKNRHVLLVVFLRGGFDGLSLICPTQGQDRKDYEAARPQLALPLSGDEAALKLDDSFAMNAAAKPLHLLFQQKRLAIVHACGLPVPSRSHFAAQTLMELGITRLGEDQRGWLTRFMQQFPSKAAAIGPLCPTSLQGASDIMAYARLKGLGLEGPTAQQVQLRSILRKLYASSGESTRYGVTALNMLDEIEDISLRLQQKDKSELPSGEIAQKFAIAGHLLQRDPKLQLMTLDIGGWDTHRQQGSTGEGYFAKQLGQLSRAIADFHQQALGASNAWVTTVVMSEFGRRVKENSNRGTDHGHGNVALVFGPRVQGGTFYGRWPGLANESLFERSDLAVTTDIRSVLQKCLQGLAPQANLSSIFSGLEAKSVEGLNFLI